MFRTKTQKTIVSLAFGVACLTAPAVSHAAPPVKPLKLTGAVAGTVKNSSGIPQMGAAVQLFNRQDHLVARVLTDDRGQFRLAGLLPSVYSIRVSLALYLPVIKRDILVQPGMRSMLNVSLSTLFSSIQLSYPTEDTGGVMSDDWKWVLRSSSATRPVLRFADDSTTGPPAMAEPLFSDTRGMVRVSAGEGPALAGLAMEADLGTAFAVATSVYGKSLLQVSGNLGYGSTTGAPATAIRTSYSRNVMGGDPQVSFTVRELTLPVRLPGVFASNDSALPMMRSMAASFDDHAQVAENVTVQYGFSMDMVSFMDHMNYYSPYARLRYHISSNSTLELAYSSGDARPNMNEDAGGEDTDLQNDLSTLGLFPRMSLMGGHPEIQQGTEYEATFSHKVNSRTYQISAYRERVNNLALSMVAPAGYFGAADMLPDMFSGNSIFDIGNFASTGYTAGVTQDLGGHFSATVMADSGEGLTTDGRQVVSNSPDELRSMIRAGRRNAVTARLAAIAPWAGTHLIASYQWTCGQRWADPGNLYSTQSFRPAPGLNVYIRQPIGKRLEATADLRNLLAQGYLPLGTSDGQTVMLVDMPRSFRGGLSFIF